MVLTIRMPTLAISKEFLQIDHEYLCKRAAVEKVRKARVDTLTRFHLQVSFA